ncbi:MULTISPECIES: mannitol dehydrogenase family protein [unclassified Curtobacterium]|jgi:mannitol 2-dehydrogenase|uniref:mannitol dehydrogenase family protein n=1 Tax=unclassified Curtobacterium TaxID=257496 RepID=UPI00052AEFB1|nr:MULTISPECIES: mannitol dehydrogenase family protein [unclassified Curtobacterium]AIV40695.1 mannitol dehydrogenase [Curtobacterium sp. MR_MD2014]MBP1302827.1 mannitol 2-dehydrogenase [Curtobacterium sp. 1310]MCM3504189.1 mannitol dehydrogenase family protein [Curtobacterium sp. ODYSSEY 48 V2]MDB6428149.1 mannitol dehydrogenase family protein [Curtobacterium sp. 20TX0008]MDT0210969.1 mannitol dehydrogenase family protein [Curtobacterium sp. BRD11]
MTVRLSPETLDRIAASGVAVPSYDRDGITPGIVHFGVGGFHRAHQAMVVDRLLQQGEAREYGICGVGVLEQDRRMAAAMAEQGGLYTLVLKHPDGTRESRVVGSIVEYLLAVDDPDAVVEKMAHPDTRIVSLTITEGGYNFDHVTGEFVADEPGVAADLRGDAPPRTVFGLVVEALRRRRDRGLEPFTVMSCDNIQGNGHVARQMFTAYARLQDPAFAAWMGEHVSFPNSMVDRITPVTTDEDRAWVRDELGIEDAWPVVAEPFFQWVLEDDHPAGRPRYEDADVQLVDDVEPYELMKLRLLNASHQGLCYFGYLSGYRYAHEATQDEAIATFLRRYMAEEATPTLHAVPGIDLDDYTATLIERFRNPEVRDTLARLCAESSDRIPKWLLPVVRENLASGGPVALSAGIVASWARYAEGTDEDGQPIQVVDRLADRLTAAARRQDEDRLAFLQDRQVFGDLVDDDRFVAAYRDALDGLLQDGAHATVTRLSRS